MLKLILFNLYPRIILFFLFICLNLSASKWVYQADLLNASNKNNIEIKELLGNVIIKKDSITLKTNKAILYSKNDELELFNDIIMTTNQDTLICDTLYYFPKKDDYIIASGNIQMSNSSGSLLSDSLYFWSLRDSMIATGNVVFKSQNGQLSSGFLDYNSNTGIIFAKDNVFLNGTNSSITSDSLFFWSNLDSVFAIGNANLKNDDGDLSARNISFSGTNDEVYAYGEAYLSNQNSNISANSIYYIKDTGYNGYSFTADGNVVAKDNQNILKGGIITYNDSTQQMSLVDNASIKNTNQELTGESIYIQFQDSTLSHISIDKNPTAINLVTAKLYNESPYTEYFDRMFGKKMFITYQENKINKLTITGMANSIYHIIKNDLLEGQNEVSGDTISLSFFNEELSSIRVVGGGIGHFIPELINSSLDTTINYSGERIHYDIQRSENYFYKDASITYQDTKLDADYIKVNWDTNKLTSHIIDNKRPRVKTDSKSEPMEGDTLFYDLVTERGKIKKGQTNLNDAFYQGKEIISDKNSNIYSFDGIYTSCDLDHPHYYFLSSKMKIIPDKHIIAKPIILHIGDLPIIGLPFAILPNKGGNRKSGWIMPSFGYSEKNGTYFHNLGYYHVINDYSDIKLLSNFYDRKGFKFNLNFRYHHRYNYTGSISSILVRDLNSNIDDIDYIFSNQVIQSWNLKWVHNQTIDPSQRFNFNINYVSRNDFYQQDQVGYDIDTRLNQTLFSSLNYSKNWYDSNNSLSINMSDSYNLLLESSELSDNVPSFYRTYTIPSIRFSHGSRLLFGDGPSWYNSIYYSINSDFKIIQKEGNILTSDIKRDTTSYQNGINHKMAISSSQKILKYINVTPSINLLESWIYGYKEPKRNEEGEFINNEYEYYNAFKRRLTGEMSLSMNTKLYGILSLNLFKLQAIRHIISPNIKYSYRPDFSNSEFLGFNIDYVTMDANGNLYDYFSDKLVSSTPIDKRESYTFSISNDFYGKFIKDTDFVKVPLLNWKTYLSYNPTYDEFHWSYLTSSFQTSISNYLNLDLKLKYDLYKENQGVRINELAANPRLVNLNSSIRFNLKGKRIIGFNTQTEGDNASNIYTPIIGNDNIWEGNFQFYGDLSRTNSSTDNFKKDFWVNTNFAFNITSKWSISYSARFDLIENELIRHDVNIYRPLHCWLFSFRWFPGVGDNNYGSGFQLLIKVKSPDLQDIRIKHTEGNMFGI